MTTKTSQPDRLINALLDARVYPHSVDEIKLVETHISWVILTGPYAYKIKKPVNLGFLDFSTLDKRKQYCEEELRLNSRSAPDIYLQVISINGSVDKPCLSSNTDIIEYAVKMNQFPQSAQLDRVLLNNQLNVEKIDAFAQMIAKFHQAAEIADENTAYGHSQHVLEPVNENITQIRKHIKDVRSHKIIDELELWIKSRHQTLLPLLNKRKQCGFIRECHGDLHLRNLAWINNKPVAFDCIEFNPDLRWIDVISDIAFLVMDLQERKQPELAQQFLNTYLEASGDYQDIQLLPFYAMYRALVRAKVNTISMAQSHINKLDNKATKDELYAYLKLAKSYMQVDPAKLIITHGASASGKTTFSQKLLQLMPAIRIRSDVERKRMADAENTSPIKAEFGKGIYTTAFSDKVYNKLAQLAEAVIDAGYSVIIDAAFLEKEKRNQFRNLANTKRVKFIILDFRSSIESMKKRIIQRQQDASDADLPVLEKQLLNFKPLQKIEQICSLTIQSNTSAKSIERLINND